MSHNDDMWAFPLNFAEPTDEDVVDTARVVLSFSAEQRTALKHFLVGLALSWPRKYAALMSYLQCDGVQLGFQVRKEQLAREALARRRMQTENDPVCKMLKGTVSRKNKTFHTKSVALDMMGRARLKGLVLPRDGALQHLAHEVVLGLHAATRAGFSRKLLPGNLKT